MQSVLHRANTRGHADYGWLDTYHSFSFARYYNSERMNFGALRVLNDDFVAGGKGFDTHPHDNMEIISIPLFGVLEHKDSMGNKFVINREDVQILSAGSGILHSEYNKNQDSHTNFLQIWIYPKEKDIIPKYDQKTFDPIQRINNFQMVVSPDNNSSALINQDAYISLLRLESGKSIIYDTKLHGNGIYFFVIEGEFDINGQELGKRDGFGVWEVNSTNINSSVDSELLVIEVPMILG